MTVRTPYHARVHAPGATVDARAYDFESPELISGDQRGRLESAFETWGKQVGMQITAKTRTVVDVAVAPFTVQSYGAFAAPDGDPNLFLTARIGDSDRALYRVPVAEARYWAARMIGADGQNPRSGGLTPVERALAWSAAEEHVGELREATGGLLPEPAAEAFGAAPSGVDPDALAVTVVVGLLRRGQRQRIALAVPADLVLRAVGAASGPQDAATVTSRLGTHVALAPVEVALRFAGTRVGPSVVLDLARGDVIPLAHAQHSPLLITLDGEAVLAAAVGTSGERLACVVVDPDGGAL